MFIISTSLIHPSSASAVRIVWCGFRAQAHALPKAFYYINNAAGRKGIVGLAGKWEINALIARKSAWVNFRATRSYNSGLNPPKFMAASKRLERHRQCFTRLVATKIIPVKRLMRREQKPHRGCCAGRCCPLLLSPAARLPNRASPLVKNKIQPPVLWGVEQRLEVLDGLPHILTHYRAQVNAIHFAARGAAR